MSSAPSEGLRQRAEDRKPRRYPPSGPRSSPAATAVGAAGDAPVRIEAVRALSRRITLAVLVLAFTAASFADAGNRPFLWKVESGKATVYLLGSIHVARPDLYPLHGKIDEAFRRSEALVVEADPTGPGGLAAAGLMMALGTYPEGEGGLDTHLPPKLYEATASRFARYGLPPEAWQRFEPWLAAMMITMSELQRLGMTPQHGIDVHFLSRARGEKEIVELEGADAQIRMLDGFDEGEQRLFLEYTLRDADRLPEAVDELLEAWKTGDAARLEALLFPADGMNEELRPVYRKLFDDRNRVMAEKIAATLEERGTTFVIVGAGHLLGEKGLVRLLGARFEVSQVGP